jgi:hypothetical protein
VFIIILREHLPTVIRHSVNYQLCPYQYIVYVVNGFPEKS